MVNVAQKLTAEATEDDDCAIIDLWHTCALSFWEVGDGNIDENPVLTCDWTVISFNCVAVLFSWVRDTAKNVYKSVSQCTGGMVVSATIQARDIEPNIEVDVVLLASLVCIFRVNSWASDNQKFILQTSDAVTVTGIFKLVFRKNIEGVGAVINDFKSWYQLRGVLQKISTTNQEQAVWGGLNVLEVVFKPRGHVDCSF